MPRLERHVAWIWPAILLAGVISIVAFRVWSGWATRPVVATADGTEGIIEGDGADLAAAARRVRQLQTKVDQAHRRLADLRTEAADKREQIRTLEAMLTTGRLTDSPHFLHSQTTVHALQKIIREAAGSTFVDADREARLNTAAVVARERLRAKLAALADELKQNLAEIDRQAATLRQHLRLQSTSLERLRRQIQERLNPPSGAAATDAARDG